MLLCLHCSGKAPADNDDRNLHPQRRCLPTMGLKTTITAWFRSALLFGMTKGTAEDWGNYRVQSPTGREEK